METPNDEAGRMTEKIMSRWYEKAEKRGEQPSTVLYNTAYAAVYETLREAGIK